MQSRNGNDDLCRTTFIASILLYILSVILDILSLESIGSILYFVAFLRYYLFSVPHAFGKCDGTPERE